MATTRIIPMHINKGKTISQCLEDRTNYAENPEKTEGGTLISSFACDPKTAASEFAMAKREYRELTGRTQQRDIIAYQVRQSFKPGEVSPEEANQIGYEFAQRFTKGKHAFIVCTHTDKAHIHNHIIWNSTTLDCTRKFQNFWGSMEAVRKLSDLICIEHRLSVIENPKRHGMSYDKWLGDADKLSQRDRLRTAVDAALEKKPKSFDQLLQFLEEAGYTAKPGKYLSFSHDGQKKNIRLRSLGEGYSEEDLRQVLEGSRIHTPFVKRKYPNTAQRPMLISDIDARINSGKGLGYERWGKVFRLKQMAKSVQYMQEHGYEDYDEMRAALVSAKENFRNSNEANKMLDKKMKENRKLQTQIINYFKTKKIYTAYRKSGYSKNFLAEHESEILLHKAAKKAFDELGLNKLPSIKSLKAEYSRLQSQKRKAYGEYKSSRNDMRELEINCRNVAVIIGRENEEPWKEEYQHEEK